jgi:MEMO1 family protein
MASSDRKKIRHLSAALAILFAGVVSLAALPAEAPTLPSAGAGSAEPAERITVPVETSPYFYPSIGEHPPEEAGGLGMEPAGAIVPHHALASPAIAEFFSKLAQDDPAIGTFIILGPNHKDTGLAPVISCRVNWQASFGSVVTDIAFLRSLEKARLIAFDEENCTPDQAIQTLVPFIEYYFPDAKIAPLLFSSEEGRQEALYLAGEIAASVSADTFILASLDFSHYLSYSQAEENDAFTLAAIGNRDYSAISRMDSDFVDSPAALIALLRAVELMGASRSVVLYHGNSAEYPGQPDMDTTSYFTMAWGK